MDLFLAGQPFPSRLLSADAFLVLAPIIHRPIIHVSIALAPITHVRICVNASTG
jgi:hypothetical protein